MSRLRRTVATVPAMAMVITGAAMVSTAEAAPQSVSSCGTTISSGGTYNLTNDIGPCLADGIDITHNNVTLNLNGHTITGNNSNNTTNNQWLGVQLQNVKNVTVQGPGTITGFDAGVAVNGGSDNTIRYLNVHDNIAHVLLTGGVDPNNPIASACDFGDGITTDNSDNNTITGNTATHNGPFSGISLVDDSDSNTVTHNTVADQSVPNILQGGAHAGSPGPCGPMGGNTVGQGRPHQDTGIRIEGPGANFNVVDTNTVTDSILDGIAVFDNVCSDAPAHGGPPGTAPNDSNMITNNTVRRNGGTDLMNGIAILSQGPGGIVCIPSHMVIKNNTSNNNTGSGIFLGGRGSTDNTVSGNTVKNNDQDGINLASGTTGDTINSNIIANNGRDGLSVTAGAVNHTIKSNTAHGDARFDGFDGNQNPPCDNNHYVGNSFGTVNVGCLRNNGGTGTLKAATDLAVAVSATPSRLHGNGTATYTVTVTNTGNAPADLQTAAANVLLTDTLPSAQTDPNTGVVANAIFLSGSTSQGSCDFPAARTRLTGQDATCHLGTLAPGQSATVTINVALASHSRAASNFRYQFTDTASVSTTTLEPNTSNNTASGTVVYTVT